MTLQKLSAGSGYEYLTRQVAALDSTEKRNIPLADHYAAKVEQAHHAAVADAIAFIEEQGRRGPARDPGDEA